MSQNRPTRPETAAMTGCNAQPMLFSNLDRRRVQADFDGSTLTGNAGALLLREADQRIGLIDAINRMIIDQPHRRRGLMARYSRERDGPS